MELNGETLRFIREHRKDDVRSLALQAPKYPDVDMPVALTQIAGRKYRPGMRKKAFYIPVTYR